MEWLGRYITKRINKLKQQTIHDIWRKMYLEKAADEIATRQQDTKKAPSDDQSIRWCFLFIFHIKFIRLL